MSIETIKFPSACAYIYPITMVNFWSTDVLRPSLILFACISLANCGGGGGGGGGGVASTPPSPTISVQGNKGVYRQDEPVVIQFSASNMDQNTLSWSVANFDDDAFKLDSSNGVFRSVESDYETSKSWLTTTAGEYSLTVTATDGNGKTASRSFQFRIDLIPTGYFIAYEPQMAGTAERTLHIDFTRDGLAFMQAFGYRGTQDSVIYGGLMTENLTCFGDSQIVGAKLDGTVNCGGKIASQLYDSYRYWNDTGGEIYISEEFNDVGSITFSLVMDEYNDLRGSINLYSPAGGLLESWDSRFLSEQDFGQGFWVAPNEDLAGRYVAYAADSQYTTTVTYPDGRFSRDLFWGSLMLDIATDYSFSSPPQQACQITGSMDQVSIDEWITVTQNPEGGHIRNNRQRIMGADYSAIGCNELGTGGTVFGENPINLNQSSGPALIGVLERGGISDWENKIDGLVITGAGTTGPFRFDLIKVCEPDGNPISPLFIPEELTAVCTQ